MVVSARGVKLYFRRLWRSLDHPDGKTGITIRAFGEDLTFFGNMSPKKALCCAMFLGSTAFWIGTAIGLWIFSVFFDVTPDVKERVLRAAYLGKEPISSRFLRFVERRLVTMNARARARVRRS